MGLGPLELSGALSRVTDFAQIKHNEDNKGMIDQGNFSAQFQKEVSSQAYTVKNANDTNNDQRKFDAKEKGYNSYSGDGGQKRKNNPNRNGDGNFKIKGATSGFDIRI